MSFSVEDYCCTKCFGDTKLQAIMDRQQSKNICKEDNCECFYCGTKATKLYKIADFAEVLVGFLEFYEIAKTSEKAVPLYDLLRRDWGLLEDLEDQKAGKLLMKVFADLEEVGNLENRSEEKSLRLREEADEIWSQFTKEIVSNNRWLWDESIKESLKEATEWAFLFTSVGDSSDWYRCRISSDNAEYKSESEMREPPAEKSVVGRANPQGISYLYLSASRKTAVHEVRPHPGQKIYIAKFMPQETMRLADLTDVLNAISPFSDRDDRRDLEKILFTKIIMDKFSQALSKPVTPGNEAEYIPTQYLCECFKSVKADGIIYNSSLHGEGKNLVLFSTRKVKIASVDDDIECYKVTQLEVEFDT